MEQSSNAPVATNVQPPPEDEGKRSRPNWRSFSAKATVVQVLPTPLSFKPLNLEDDILVEVENLQWPGGTPPELPSGRFGIITLRDRDEDEESNGSPEIFVTLVF